MRGLDMKKSKKSDSRTFKELLPAIISVSKNIKRIRQMLDMTQKEFARFLGVSQSLISQAESGKRSFSAEKYPILQELFDLIYVFEVVKKAIKATKKISDYISPDIVLPASLFSPLELPDRDGFIDMYSLSFFLDEFLSGIRIKMLEENFQSLQAEPWLALFKENHSIPEYLFNLSKLARYNFSSWLPSDPAILYSLEYPKKAACISISLLSSPEISFILDIYIEDQIAFSLKGHENSLIYLIFSLCYHTPSQYVVEPDRFGMSNELGNIYIYFQTDILYSFFTSFLSSFDMNLPFQIKSGAVIAPSYLLW
jgi:transcriptional regulator with XRE-family HTH domain